MFCVCVGAFLLPLALFAQAPDGTGWRDPFPGVQRPQTVPYHAGRNVGYPKLIRRVDPTLALSNNDLGDRSSVTLELVINEKGEVWQARVVSGPPLLIDAALASVRLWLYEPTIVDGRPSPVVTTTRVNFSPQHREVSKCGAEAPRIEPIRVGSHVQQLKLLHKVEPTYPPGFRGRGTIMLQAGVNEHGDVYEVWLLRGPSTLKQAVLAAVCQWKYSPTYLNGVPVPVIATVAIEFNLPPIR